MKSILVISFNPIKNLVTTVYNKTVDNIYMYHALRNQPVGLDGLFKSQGFSWSVEIANSEYFLFFL